MKPLKIRKGDHMYRTWMFVPGSQDKHLKKAADLSADVLIFDLEDAVPTVDKETARLKVKECIQKLEKKVSFVRVNALSTPYFLEDIKQIASPHLSGIILPKTNNREDIIIADYLLEQQEQEQGLLKGSLSIVPLIETAQGLNNAEKIASASERVSHLSFGAEDFMLDLNMDAGQEEQELLYARSKLVTASRSAGKEAPVDSVYTDFKDDIGLGKAAKKGKMLGFQGKLVIHPKQIDVVNQIFSPTSEQIAKARKIIQMYDASEKEEGGVIQIDGKMVDVPVAERARKILSYVGEEV